jgi:hypothetical protein
VAVGLRDVSEKPERLRKGGGGLSVERLRELTRVVLLDLRRELVAPRSEVSPERLDDLL